MSVIFISVVLLSVCRLGGIELVDDLHCLKCKNADFRRCLEDGFLTSKRVVLTFKNCGKHCEIRVVKCNLNQVVPLVREKMRVRCSVVNGMCRHAR